MRNPARATEMQVEADMLNARRRIEKLEQTAPPVVEGQHGWMITVDGITGEILRKTAVSGNATLVCPDNHRSPHRRLTSDQVPQPLAQQESEH